MPIINQIGHHTFSQIYFKLNMTFRKVFKLFHSNYTTISMSWVTSFICYNIIFVNNDNDMFYELNKLVLIRNN